MARRRRSLIGGARKATQRVSTDAPAEARASGPEAPEEVELASPEPEDSDSDEMVEERSEPRAEAAGMTIVPDADELDELLGDPEYGQSFDVLGVADDTPPPIQREEDRRGGENRAPDDLIDEPTPAPSPPDEPPPFDEAPTQQDASTWAANVAVEDAAYVETGKFAEDTTDHGWQQSVYGGPATMSSEMDEDVAFPSSASMDRLGRGFIDMSDGARPPTEEAPGAVMEDLSQVYSAPMSVPEPPPVPGIVDRYTPPPMARRGPNPPTGVDSRRPAFTPNPAPRSTPSRPVAATPAPDLRRRPSMEESRSGGPTVPLVVAFGLGAVVFGLMVALVLTLVNMRSMADNTTDAPIQPVPSSQEPAVPAPAGLPLDGDVEPSGEVPVRDGIGVDEEIAPEMVTPEVPEPGRTPAPVAAPSPRPAAPSPAPSDRPVATNGTLSIESNRRVLVSINGIVYDFTPIEVAVPAGEYTISTALPSRPDSEQTRSVTLEAGQRREMVFRF